MVEQMERLIEIKDIGNWNKNIFDIIWSMNFILIIVLQFNFLTSNLIIQSSV